MESEDEIQLRIYVEGNIDRCILVKYTRKKGEARILEKDYVNVYGKMNGLVTYETVNGTKVTMPSISAKYIDIY